MRRVDIIMPGLLALFGAVILWQSLTSMVYFNFDRGAPGPGFLPFWVSLGVLVLGIILVVQGVRARVTPDAEWPDAAGRRRIAIVVASIALFLLGLQVIGFTLSTILFLGGVSYFLGMRRLWILLPFAIAVAVGLHTLFGVWLRVSLPNGLITGRVLEVLPWIS